MINLEEMSATELTNLKINIEMEINRRQKLEYDKAVKKFADALYELCDKFPFSYCIEDEGETWQDLHDNHNWDF